MFNIGVSEVLILFLMVAGIAALFRMLMRRTALPQTHELDAAQLRQMVESLEKMERRIKNLEEIVIGARSDPASTDSV